MVGTHDAVCVDRRAVGAGDLARVCGAEAEVLIGKQTDMHGGMCMIKKEGGKRFDSGMALGV